MTEAEFWKINDELVELAQVNNADYLDIAYMLKKYVKPAPTFAVGEKVIFYSILHKRKIAKIVKIDNDGDFNLIDQKEYHYIAHKKQCRKLKRKDKC